MKKTLLATAIIGALSATAAAQAATVYDQDGTKLDIYGRIGLGIEGGGEEFNSGGERVNRSANFRNVGSRLGLRMSQAVTSDLTAFGRLEWRFKANSREDAGNGFDELRQSYLGIQSQQYGTFQAGNFDAFYLQFVSQPFDVYIGDGFHFAGNDIQSRGDSIGYYTPDLAGFTAFLQLKHYSERGLREVGQPDGVVLQHGDPGVVSEQGNVVAPQGGVRYEQGPITVGLGFVEDVRRGGGNGEMLYGLMGQYEFTDQFSARLGYEHRGNNGDASFSEAQEDGYNRVGLGATYTTGPWAFTGDYYNINRDGDRDNSHAWSLGSYYKVSSAMDVFLEVNDNDSSFRRDGSDASTPVGQRFDNLTSNAYWMTGVRYFF